MVLVGIVQSIFFVNLPKIVSATIYLIAGYLILPYMNELYHQIGVKNFWLIIAGGIIYSLGAITYGLKNPFLTPEFSAITKSFISLLMLGPSSIFWLSFL